MLIESIGHGKRILAQMYPSSSYDNDTTRFNQMLESIKTFEFKNEEHRSLLRTYVCIKCDCKTDRFI